MALKPADIMVVKTLKTPPTSVKLIFAGMSAIAGLQPEKQADPQAKKNVTRNQSISKSYLILILISILKPFLATLKRAASQNISRLDFSFHFSPIYSSKKPKMTLKLLRTPDLFTATATRRQLSKLSCNFRGKKRRREKSQM